MLTKDAILSKDLAKIMKSSCILSEPNIISLFDSVLSDNFREDSDIDIGIYFESRQYYKNSVCDAVIDFFITERIDVAFLK
jgi:predicted nucleotidyltransferase